MTPAIDGLDLHDVPTRHGTVRAAVGGAGPPLLLLLHGYPETHLMWHAAAPLLAERFTVVACDLPGYGASERPAAHDDHLPHAKRTWGAALADVMTALGHERFAVAGHDRGARVAYRMALDLPDRVARLCVLDVVPTVEVWERADDRMAIAYWHWPFLAQPAPLPEALIGGAPEAFWDAHVTRMGIDPADGDHYPPAVLAAYRAQLDDPGFRTTICEDYRAGATVDREHDAADREAGRRIACPTLALWGSRGALEVLYGDVLEVWRPWCGELTGHAVDASHFLVEDRPAEVATAIADHCA
ncbi:alpha/beta fold hydrolase [Patulibacter minatonensis]|uniref:alpha/beta fold hydrolase n=1 Tax=Patulibacter minatonensis TaxID=298163 RepID=UPI001B7FC59D|nr:alpha/beta fold hydrolase [Patulibacter minatonensis]